MSDAKKVMCAVSRDLSEYKNHRRLIETTDPEVEKTHLRRSGFEGVVSFAEIDDKLSEFLRQSRESENLSRAALAEMLGLSAPVYARYERSFSRLTVARLVHLCEIFGSSPSDMLYAAAPHLFGDTPEKAQTSYEIQKIVTGLSQETQEDALRLLRRLDPMRTTPAPADEKENRRRQRAKKT